MTLNPRYVVQAYFGPFNGFQTVTSYIEWQQGLTITRGRRDTASDPTPSRCSFVLDDADGRFSPELTTGAYYPFMTDGLPVRVFIMRPSSVNLEDNNGAELGMGEWAGLSFFGGGTGPTIAQSTTHVRTGSWAGLITWANQAVESEAARDVWGLTPGVTYTWSRYVYVPTGSPDVKLRAIGGGLGFGTSGTATSTKNAFTRISVTFTAVQTTCAMEVVAASSVGGGQCWVDDGQGEEGSSATTLGDPALKIGRYYGFLTEAPFVWPASGIQALSSWQCADLSERVGSRAGSLRPFDVEEALLDQPKVLLPLSESDTATQVANLGSAQSVGTLVQSGSGGVGALQLGAGTGPPSDGQSAAVFAPTGLNGYYIRVANAGIVSTAVTLEAWVNTTVDSAVVVDADNSATSSTGPLGSMRVASGKLRWYSDQGALIVNSTTTVTDGLTHHCAVTYEETGSQHTAKVYVDGVLEGTGSVSSTWAVIVVTYVLAGGAKPGLFTGTLSMVAAYDHALTADRILAHYQAGWTGFGGERSDQRISRLAAYARLSSLTPAYRTGVWVLDSSSLSVLDTTTILADSDLSLEYGQAIVYGQSTGGSDYMSEMRSAAGTEGGVLLVDVDGRLDFQGRQHRYNQPPKVTVSAESIGVDLAPRYDTQYVVNTASATTQDGAVVTYANSASVTQRGTFADAAQLLTRDQMDAWSAVTNRVSRQAVPRVRYTSVSFDLATLDDATVTALLGLDVGDRIQVTDLPPQAPASTVTLFVEGYQEQTSHDSWSLVLDTSPGDQDTTWVLDSPTASVLDTTTIPAY